MKGKFITFEGSEGCGKSTQSKLACEYLKRKGYDVLFIREPGGTKISEKIRVVLLDKKNDQMSQMCEMLLYMAARSQIIDEVIKPALKKGKIVVCDRFLDSTVAYQGYGLGMSVHLINSLGHFVTQGIHPDLTLLLDVPVKKGLSHRAGISDRIEQRSIAYHNRVRQGYFKLAKLDPARIKVIKVAADKNITQERIRKAIAENVLR